MQHPLEFDDKTDKMNVNIPEFILTLKLLCREDVPLPEDPNTIKGFLCIAACILESYWKVFNNEH